MNELNTMMANIAAELTEAENLYEYFEDVLDFEYTIDSRKNYRSAKVWLTLGGPNIWLDTADNCLHGAWGCTRELYPLPVAVCAEVDSIFEEYYNC